MDRKPVFTAQTFEPAEEEKQIKLVQPAEVRPFQEHTFKVRDDAGMKRLIKSVTEHGILEPALAFINEEGELELISGHRRRKVAIELKLEHMPVLIKEVSRAEATVLMGEANLMQREKVLPSEKAFTYQAMLEAIRQMPDKEVDIERSRDILSKRIGESPAQIQRYIRLIKLMTELLDLVDMGKMSLRSGLDIAGMGGEQQQEIYRIFCEQDIIPTSKQTHRMKEMQASGELKVEQIRELLLDQDKDTAAEQKIIFASPIIVSLLSPYLSLKEREERIIRGLKLLEAEERRKEIRSEGKEEEEQSAAGSPLGDAVADTMENEKQTEQDHPSERDKEEEIQTVPQISYPTAEQPIQGQDPGGFVPEGYSVYQENPGGMDPGYPNYSQPVDPQYPQTQNAQYPQTQNTQYPQYPGDRNSSGYPGSADPEDDEYEWR
ncbi:MAG: ParB/RepB/Spo0J family partition protein [Eubacterium sp.]|nr:ParB/RepB/Spo0J family partition protein [Eubacterium sp.]